MAEEIIQDTVVEQVEETIEEQSSLIDVVAEEQVEEEVVDEEKEVVEKEEEVIDTNVDVKEAIEKFGDLMEDGQLNTILEKFNKGETTGKDLISEILNEVGIAKDELEEKIDVEIDSVKQGLIDRPIEGIDLKDLGGWVSKQGEDMVNIATTLTDFSLGEEAVRSAIALLNKVRMGTVDVGDPSVNLVQKTSVNRDSLREEYMNIYQTKDGMERVTGIENLVKKAEKTGDEELISWAKGMFN